MKIAIPLADNLLSMHFGHCQKFAVIDVDQETKTVKEKTEIDPPPHQPGLLPKWLGEMGVNVIIAGGMGQRAQALFAQQNIDVVVGAPAESAEAIVTAYLNGTLQTGDNVCDH